MYLSFNLKVADLSTQKTTERNRTKRLLIDYLIRNQKQVKIVLIDFSYYEGVISRRVKEDKEKIILRETGGKNLGILFSDIDKIYSNEGVQFLMETPVNQVRITPEKYVNLGTIFTWFFVILFAIILIIGAYLDSTH